MKNITVSRILMIMMLFVATISLYIMAKETGRQKFTDINNTLLHLESLNANLDAMLLSIRFQLRIDYDGLLRLKEEINKSRKDLIDINTKNNSFWKRGISVDYTALFSAIDMKFKLVEEFKSDYAILRNSQMVFPVVVENARSKSLNIKTEKKFYKFEAEGLKYVLSRSDAFETILKSISEQQDFQNFRKSNDWAILKAHSDSIIEYKKKVDEILPKILDGKVAQSINTILQSAKGQYESNLSNAAAFQLVLFVWAVILLVFSGYKIFQTHKYAAALEESNDLLETRVEKRTRQLADTEKRTRLILESLNAGVMAINDDGYVAFANQTSAKNLGYAPEELGSESFDSTKLIVADNPVEEAYFASAIKDIKPYYQKEDYLLKKDGKHIPVEFTYVPMINGHDAIKAVITFQDISEKKAAQKEMDKLNEELKMAQKLEAIGQMAAGIAHEINTPTQYVGDHVEFLQTAFDDMQDLLQKYKQGLEALNTIDDKAELLNDINDFADEIDMEFLEEEISKAFDNSLDGVNKISEIVKAMKGFAHPGNETKEPTDLNQALENTITVCCNEWKYIADVKKELQSDLPLVECFPGELNQVFLNLIVNAAHAIEGKHENTEEDKGIITVQSRIVNNSVEVNIQDTGTGIPERSRDRIFDPFYTTKAVGKGTGQGLAIAHSIIVDKHQGKLDFTTEEGVGTTFHIKLPIEADQSLRQAV